jgi:AraC-like DNA-binding protein
VTTLRASAALRVLEIVSELGGDPNRVLDASDILAGDLDSPDRFIDLAKLVQLNHLAARELDDPAFGLHLGPAFDIQSMGLLSHAVLNAPTVEAAIQNLFRYMDTFILSITREWICEEETTFLMIDLPGLGMEERRLPIDACASVFVALMNKLLGEEWAPVEVCFRHSLPRTPAEYCRLLGAPVSFGQRADGIRIHNDDLARKIPRADAEVLPVFTAHLERSIAKTSENDPLLRRLRELIANSLLRGNPDIASVARELGTSTRSLQRQLRERDSSFRKLTEATRRDLASQHLSESDTALTEIAFLLGYSELAAFDRAFRRWTGESPLAYRKREKARAVK